MNTPQIFIGFKHLVFWNKNGWLYTGVISAYGLGGHYHFQPNQSGLTCLDTKHVNLEKW